MRDISRGGEKGDRETIERERKTCFIQREREKKKERNIIDKGTKWTEREKKRKK